MGRHGVKRTRGRLGQRGTSSIEQGAVGASSPDRPSRVPRRPGGHRSVRPGQLLAAMAILVTIVVVASVLLWGASRDPFARLPDDPSVMVVFGGIFPGADAETLAEPTGIAVSDDHVYVSESGAGRVSVYDLYGKLEGRTALEVAGGEFRAVPTAICALDGSRFAVIDARGRRVYVYEVASDDIELLFRLGDDDSEHAPGRPTALAFHADHLYVADDAAGDIKVYDREGVLLRTLEGDASAPLRQIGGMAWSGDRLIVTLSGDNRMLAVSPDTGSLLAELSGAYMLPRGVSPFGDGVVLAEVLGGAVRGYDVTGEQTHSIDATTVPDHSPVAPEGAAWSPRTSCVYVTEPDLGRIAVYRVRK